MEKKESIVIILLKNIFSRFKNQWEKKYGEFFFFINYFLGWKYMWDLKPAENASGSKIVLKFFQTREIATAKIQ